MNKELRIRALTLSANTSSSKMRFTTSHVSYREKNDNGANIIFHRPMATKEAEDMESLCLRQNRRFHILRFSPNDGISVLLICLIFSGINKGVISSGVEA